MVSHILIVRPCRTGVAPPGDNGLDAVPEDVASANKWGFAIPALMVRVVSEPPLLPCTKRRVSLSFVHLEDVVEQKPGEPSSYPGPKPVLVNPTRSSSTLRAAEMARGVGDLGFRADEEGGSALHRACLRLQQLMLFKPEDLQPLLAALGEDALSSEEVGRLWDEVRFYDRVAGLFPGEVEELSAQVLAAVSVSEAFQAKFPASCVGDEEWRGSQEGDPSLVVVLVASSESGGGSPVHARTFSSGLLEMTGLLMDPRPGKPLLSISRGFSGVEYQFWRAVRARGSSFPVFCAALYPQQPRYGGPEGIVDLWSPVVAAAQEELRTQQRVVWALLDAAPRAAWASTSLLQEAALFASALKQRIRARGVAAGVKSRHEWGSWHSWEARVLAER